LAERQLSETVIGNLDQEVSPIPFEIRLAARPQSRSFRSPRGSTGLARLPLPPRRRSWTPDSTPEGDLEPRGSRGLVPRRDRGSTWYRRRGGGQETGWSVSPRGPARPAARRGGVSRRRRAPGRAASRRCHAWASSVAPLATSPGAEDVAKSNANRATLVRRPTGGTRPRPDAAKPSKRELPYGRQQKRFSASDRMSYAAASLNWPSAVLSRVDVGMMLAGQLAVGDLLIFIGRGVATNHEAPRNITIGQRWLTSPSRSPRAAEVRSNDRPWSRAHHLFSICEY